MSELEQRLVALGRDLDLPPEPDLAARVRSSIAGAATPAPWWRRRLVVVLALAAVVVGAVLAVPDARSAILRWIGIGSVRVDFVNELPEVRVRTTLDLGERVSLADAERLAGRRLLSPRIDDLRAPDAVYLDGRRVSFLWGSRAAPKLLLQQFPGIVHEALGKKVVQDAKTAEGTTVRFATVNGRPALGLVGAPHFLMYLDPETGEPVEDQVYLAGNVLLWESGDVTLRLEGDLSFAELLRIARRTR